MGKPAASLLLQLIIEAPAEMAAGVASVEALCAGADTAPVLGPEAWHRRARSSDRHGRSQV